jgi:outer membrane lipoprotein-sorting protein
MSIAGSLFLLTKLPAQQEKANEILNKFFEQAESMRSTEFIMKMNERKQGKMHQKKALFKIIHQPFHFYYYQYYPQEGMEVLYVDGWNNNKAMINTNTFPWVNVNLAPQSTMMRQDHHHAITNAGFKYLAGVIEKFVHNHGKSNVSVKYLGQKSFNGKQCYAISIVNHSFHYMKYKVQTGENIIDIASEKYLSDYMIVDKNKNADDFYDVEEGDIIKIPSSYAEKMIMYLYPKTYLPAYLKVWDDEGLYEEFSFLDIKINPFFDKDEFSEDYQGYNF